MNTVVDIDENPTPNGTLALQTVAMPADTNPNGDIFAGWLMSQMDLAGYIMAKDIAKGRVTTVSVGSMVFLKPVPVGATVACYAECIDVGRSSITTRVEVWTSVPGEADSTKITEADFVFVAIDDNRRTRPIG